MIKAWFGDTVLAREYRSTVNDRGARELALARCVHTYDQLKLECLSKY
jgi:hypothetical protein